MYLFFPLSVLKYPAEEAYSERVCSLDKLKSWWSWSGTSRLSVALFLDCVGL